MWIRKEIARKRKQERKKNRCKITTEERNREINHKILIKEKKKKEKGRKRREPESLASWLLPRASDTISGTVEQTWLGIDLGVTLHRRLSHLIQKPASDLWHLLLIAARPGLLLASVSTALSPASADGRRGSAMALLRTVRDFALRL